MKTREMTENEAAAALSVEKHLMSFVDAIQADIAAAKTDDEQAAIVRLTVEGVMQFVAVQANAAGCPRASFARLAEATWDDARAVAAGQSGKPH